MTRGAIEGGDVGATQAIELEDRLRHIGAVPDGRIPLGEAALTLAAYGAEPAELAPYRDHLDTLAEDVTAAAGGAETGDLDRRIGHLNEVMVAHYGYRGDSRTYDDVRNAELPHVIDRRRGLPVSLGILYIHAARAQGWTIVGLDFPGHFLVRLELGAERAILDPFHGGRVVAPDELRRLLKAAAGPDAELRPGHFDAAGNREILLRLQNNLRLRLFRDGDVRRAIAVTESMLMIAPEKTALWREAGLLYAELGEVGPAISALERFLDSGVGDNARHHAAVLLQRLRGRAN